MRFISLILFSLIYSFTFSQTTILRSKGETPEFLLRFNESYFVPQKSEWVRAPKKNKSYYLDQIYSSNMVVFGDKLSKYCTSLLSRLGGSSNSVYVLRSNYAATFSSNSGDIFITTGLISQLTNEAQLSFFLLRESDVKNNNLNIRAFKNKIFEGTLENAIKRVSTFSMENEYKLDSLTFNKLNALSLYNSKEIKSSIDVLLYSLSPFYEKKIDWNYFNSENSFIPTSEFLQIKNPNPKFYKPENDFPECFKRKERLNKNNKTESSLKESNFLLNELDFKEMVEISRLESILLHNISGNFPYALYEIYILESFGMKSLFLEKMKANAWLGLLKQSNGEIEKKLHNNYDRSDNDGAVFCRFIRRLNSESLAPIALRNVYDSKNKYPTNKSLKLIYNEFVGVISKSDFFKLGEFKKENYKISFEKNRLLDSINNSKKEFFDKGKQIDVIKEFDSLKFYLYFISDIVSNKEFVTLFNSKMNLTSDSTEIQRSKINIHSLDFKVYKFGKINESKITDFNIPKIYSDLSEVSKIEIKKDEITRSSEDWYNKKYYLNSTIIQNYNYTSLTKKIIPIHSDDLGEMENDKTSSFGVYVYKHNYKPRLRSLHFTGLFVVTLPYLIPEFFYSGNKTTFSAFYFNAETGLMEGVSTRNFKDPCNKYLFKNSILKTISTNYIPL